MRRVGIAAVWVAVMAAPAAICAPNISQDDVQKNLLYCRGLGGDPAMLQCFERLVDGMQPVAPHGGLGAEVVPAATGWTVRLGHDGKTTVASHQADDAVTGGMVTGDGPARLVIECLAGVTSAYITFGAKIAEPGDSVHVAVLADAASQYSGDWSVSRSGRAIGQWDPPTAAALAKAVEGSRQVAFRVNAGGFTNVSVHFDLSSGNEPLRPLETACWSK